MTCRILVPESPEAFRRYYALRWQLLRQPWGQPVGSERDSLEDQAVHAMAVAEKGIVVGVGRLHRIDERSGQIRYMAVAEIFRGQGIGTALLTWLEQRAMALQLEKLILNAREDSVVFYSHRGYQVVGPGHTLYNVIAHQQMSKSLVKPGSPPQP